MKKILQIESLNDFYDVTGVKHYTLLHEGYKEGKYKISVKFFNINKSSNSDSSVRFRIYTFEDNVYNYLLDEDHTPGRCFLFWWLVRRVC